ncbi:MAG: glycosyltransferase [Deltaproteobacteria bacterium]|jgi:hypothetical protein
MLTALFVVSCISFALALGCHAARVRMPVLEELRPPDPDVWPTVSVVIAARDEIDGIEAAIQSRLADDYPALRIIIVDDRSTDGTSAVADRLAEDPRVTAVHVDALPDGWLGKVHAMHRGIEAARGEWILLSDADVHLEPGALRTVVAHAEANGIDHVGVLPTVWPKGVVFDAVLAAFVRLMSVATLVTPIGVGAFNLVRRRAYDASPGMPALRMEVGDDVELARLLVRSGAKSVGLNGRRVVHLEFYRSLRSMAKHMEKVAGIQGGHPLGLVVASCVFALVEIAPFVGALFEPWRVPSLAIGAFVLLTSVVMNRAFAQPGPAALLSPFGALIGAAFLARAGLLALWRGGIEWRGTFYPQSTLQRAATHQRRTRDA